LQGRSAELPGRGTVLPRRNAELQGRRTVLPRRNAELPGRGTLLQGRSAELPGRKTVLRRRKTVLPGRKTVLRSRKTLLRRRKTVLRGRRAVLASDNILPADDGTPWPGGGICVHRIAAGLVTWLWNGISKRHAANGGAAVRLLGIQPFRRSARWRFPL
jgi:hypothetical protein